MRRPIKIGTSLTTALLLSLTLAACSGDGEPKAEPETVEVTADDGTVTEVPAEPETWPLTGLEVKGGGKAEANHPVIVTKIDNTASSSPQVGLSHADMVVEELVEGGVTRLAAFFYSDVPGTVGPVRSMRASDIGIVTPVKGTVVTSGAASVTISRINGAGIKFFSEGAKGFFRDNARYAPYNLFATLKATAGVIKQKAARPADYLPWGDADTKVKGPKASTLSADFGNHATTWKYADGRYVNENSFAGADDQFPTETVLVLRVQVGDAGYTDPAGYPVPETKFVGKGQALLFHDGRLQKGTWSKDKLTSPIKLSTKGGDLLVPPGRTWIELVPVDDAGGSVSWSK